MSAFDPDAPERTAAEEKAEAEERPRVEDMTMVLPFPDPLGVVAEATDGTFVDPIAWAIWAPTLRQINEMEAQAEPAEPRESAFDGGPP